jgi:cob(I)alamin adenosyltransferase
MKLYTGIGDDGSTRLFGNTKVGKDDPRVEAYGCVDELNSAIGLAQAICSHEAIGRVLTVVQNRLFDLGADLATPAAPGDPSAAGMPSPVRRIGAADAAELERFIDEACAPLPPLKSFILPGGCELAARLHLARTICRRAERACVALSRRAHGAAAIIIFLNRLSDLLFALARRANQLTGVEDVPWRKT